MTPGTMFGGLKLELDIVDRLRENGIEEMTPVQAEAIPHMLQHKDLIVQSQTGSGKTLAYLVPLASFLRDSQSLEIQALVVVPTRELCMQVSETAGVLGLRSEIFIGGTPIEEDVSRLQTSVCIATPGRLLELMLRNPRALGHIRFLILDESDKLLDFGFESKLLTIIGMLPRSRVTGLFSATISDAVTRLSQHSLRNPANVKVTAGIPDKLKLMYLITPPDEKLGFLLKLASRKRCIVFFATCAEVEFFHSLLHKYYEQNSHIGVVVHKMHGRLEQSDRGLIYGRFEETGGILLCTDVAARGIDFKNIEMVLHFDTPKDVSNIIHRSGRTARNGTVGISVIFIMPNESTYVEFLRLKHIDVEEYRMEGPEDRYALLGSLVDDVLLMLSVKAFVSYFRSYKEHIVNYVLNYKELDFDGLAALFFLRKIPTMPELKNITFKNYPRTASNAEGRKHVLSKRKCNKNRGSKAKKHC